MTDEARTGEGQNPQSIGPALVVEIDRLGVRATLFSEVEGQSRFIAVGREAALPDGGGVSEAIGTALTQVAAQSGLSIASDAGESSRLSAVGVTGQPVRATRVSLIVVGGQGPLVEPLVSAARATPTIVETLAEGILTDEGNISGAQLESALRSFEPDVVLILAGDEAQRQWGTVVGTLTPLLQAGVVGQAVVLGNDDLQQHVIQMAGEDANLMGLNPSEYGVAEVASAVEIELQSVFDSRVTEQGLSGLPGSPGFLSRGRSLDLVTRFLARRGDRAVASVNIDDGTTIAWADPTMGIVVNRPELDARFSARVALSWNPQRILKQLPFSLQLEDLNNWIMNRQIRPETRAERSRDQIIEAAIMSEVLRRAWIESFEDVSASRVELLVAGPAFAGWESPAIGLLSLQNALLARPVSGVVDVVFDGEGVSVAAGAIGEVSPAIAADAVEHDLAIPIASLITIDGAGQEGELALRGEISVDGGDSEQFSVPFGSLHRLNVPEGAEASLRIVCEEGFSIRGGAQPGFDEPQTVVGSQLGIVIDARGWAGIRDSDQAFDPERVASWYADLGYEPDL